jgi:hypothetical protein
VAADIEEGATVAEAILKVGQVVTNAVECAKPPDEAGGDLLTGGGPGRNLTLLATALCPMVGTNCNGNLETVAMERLIGGARRW